MYFLTRWGSQFRVGRTERRGDAPPREMIAQADESLLDRMRLIDRPEASIFYARFISLAKVVHKQMILFDGTFARLKKI